MSFRRVEGLLGKLLSPTDVNDCAAQPCSNGGICRDLDGDYTCQCPSPYVGKQCQLRTFTFVILKLVKNILHLNTSHCCKEDFAMSCKHFISVLHQVMSDFFSFFSKTFTNLEIFLLRICIDNFGFGLFKAAVHSYI